MGITDNQRRKRYPLKLLFVLLFGFSSRNSLAEARIPISFRPLSPLLQGRSLPVVRLRNKFTKRGVIPCSTATKKNKKSTGGKGTGFYYGLSEEFLNRNPMQEKEQSPLPEKKRKKNLKSRTEIQQKPGSALIEDILSDTLSEFRSTSEELRDTLEAIRQEMAHLSRIQKQMLEQQNRGSIMQNEDFDEDEQEIELSPAAKRRKLKIRREQYDKLAREVEDWAERLLFEEGGEEDGWKDIECSKLLRSKFNGEGKIKCFLKWLPDPRGKKTDPTDDKEYPCIRCYTTIDAPLEHVCQYLSDEEHMKDYNDLVIKHRDLEDVSPHSKICWGQCPQILFIKPRDFVTFCHHRWKKDGTQVIVNQAVEHEDAPATLEEGKSNACRAYALRGANFLSKDPSDPNKTRFAILAQGSPGGNLPSWACKAAVNAIVPIEPFKLFYNIEKGIKQADLDSASNAIPSSSNSSERSSKPGGLSQLGYACFWPNGGGLKEEDELISDEF